MSDLETLAMSVSPLDKFREYLSTRRQRITPERETIVEEVFASHEHFDAEELIMRLAQRTDGRRVGRATVYRTLESLVAAGLLRKVARANDREIYEHDYGYPQHDHLICRKCGTLIEFENSILTQILEDVASEHKFVMSGHRLEVHGLCSTCSRPPQMRHRKLDMI